ncbi:MAG TPA: hypothetical protein PKA90_15315 [Ignavibacteria bacterium]|nr:hypothetical protein [Ignavibacteria bacterium]HMR41788.1 hypothetical protein [Ignavibacteria bacterium]
MSDCSNSTIEERFAQAEILKRKVYPEINDPGYRTDKTVFRVIHNE